MRSLGDTAQSEASRRAVEQAALRTPPPTSEPWRRRFRRARRKAGSRALELFGPKMLTGLVRSWRYEVLHRERRDEATRTDGSVVFTLWHGRMLLGLPEAAQEEVRVLVSASDDGSLATSALAAFGYRVIRGSTSHGGARAMREMLTALRADGHLVLTPDGPRGPRHSIGHGVAWISKATGRAVVPVGLASGKSWHLSSWDRFTIPRPRARVVCCYGEPVRVQRGATDEDLDRATELIRQRMLDAEREAFAHLSVEPDF